MKTKRLIIAIAILFGGVLFTVDALNTDVNGEDTATTGLEKKKSELKKTPWG